MPLSFLPQLCRKISIWSVHAFSNSALISKQTKSSSQFVFIENFIQHTFPAKRQYTGIVCCYTEDFFFTGKDQIKLRLCRSTLYCIKNQCKLFRRKKPNKKPFNGNFQELKIKSHTQEIWTPSSICTQQQKRLCLFKFYTSIFLNIQFLNVVFTEPTTHYRGHSFCAVKIKKKEIKNQKGL